MTSSENKRFNRKLFDKYGPDSQSSPTQPQEELIAVEIDIDEKSDELLIEDIDINEDVQNQKTSGQTQQKPVKSSHVSSSNKLYEKKDTKAAVGSTSLAGDEEKLKTAKEHDSVSFPDKSEKKPELRTKKPSSKKSLQTTEENSDSDFSETAEESSAQKRSLSKAEQGKVTPTRKEQEQARKKPLVQSPAQSREEKRHQRVQEKEQRDAERQRQQEALKSGDPRADKYLPERDRGPQKRYARDLIDGMKYDLGQYVIIIVLLLIIPSFLPLNETIKATIMIVFYAFLLVMIISRIFIARKVDKAVKEEFGSVEKGVVMYAVMRSIQFRRWRLPKPMVEPGEKPRPVKTKK